MGNYFWFSSIKIDYSDYLKNLFSRINEVYVVVFYSDILLKKKQTSFKQFVLLQSNLLLCKQGFCDDSVTLYNASVTLPPALSKYIFDVHPWSDSTEFRGIGRGSSDCLEPCPCDL